MAEKIKVLLVDDDERLLQGAKRVLHGVLDLDVASTGALGLEMMARTGPYQVVVSDQNMPGMNGVIFLQKVRDQFPHCVRMMLTGNVDQGTAISAVNEGKIFRFLNKPIKPDDLLRAIDDAFRYYQSQAAERELLEKTLSGSVRLLVDMLSLSNPAAFHRGQRIRKWASAVGTRMKVERRWELEMAAMLTPLGDIMLPQEIQAKREAKQPLNSLEQGLYNQTPQNVHDLIINIPRLRGVAEAILYSKKGFDGSGVPEDSRTQQEIPQFGRILKVLLDLSEASGPDGEPTAAVLKTLVQNERLYDPVVLRAVAMMIGQGGDKDGLTARKKMILDQVSKLQEGDLVMTDIKAPDGRLLLVRGTELSLLMVKKLRQINALSPIPGQVEVMRPDLSTGPMGSDGAVQPATSI